MIGEKRHRSKFLFRSAQNYFIVNTICIILAEISRSMPEQTAHTILLFYAYVPIEYPKQVQKWQLRLCTELGLKGRIILAHEGINGTVSGLTEAVMTYQQAMLEHPLFAEIDFKQSDGSSQDFPRLRVVVKEEIVRMGISPNVVTAETSGRHLNPLEAHQLMAAQPHDLVILDGRNDYESRIGAFENAIKPAIENFRDFPDYIDNNADQFKDKTVLMYCTGGIRCERASAYLKSKGIAKEVLQITGGIHRYAEQFPNGFFKGKNYVFDSRVAMKVSDDILGQCDMCGIPSDEYSNCISTCCNKQVLSCPSCTKIFNNTCGQACFDLVNTGMVKTRVQPRKPQESSLSRE